MRSYGKFTDARSVGDYWNPLPTSTYPVAVQTPPVSLTPQVGTTPLATKTPTYDTFKPFKTGTGCVSDPRCNLGLIADKDLSLTAKPATIPRTDGKNAPDLSTLGNISNVNPYQLSNCPNCVKSDVSMLGVIIPVGSSVRAPILANGASNPVRMTSDGVSYGSVVSFIGCNNTCMTISYTNDGGFVPESGNYSLNISNVKINDALIKAYESAKNGGTNYPFLRVGEDIGTSVGQEIKVGVIRDGHRDNPLGYFPTGRVPSNATPTSQSIVPSPSSSVESLVVASTNPQQSLVSNIYDFSSTFCQFGNERQDQDFIEAGNWGPNGVYRNGCKIGSYYSDGEKKYLIPPGSLPNDGVVKALTTLQLIADTKGLAQPCETLGDVGIRADGVEYRCNACGFFRPGGTCSDQSGTKSLVMPNNANIVLDPAKTGGVGAVGTPIVTFKSSDFSFYFTGNPARIFFDNMVVNMGSNITPTIGMGQNDINSLASQIAQKYTLSPRETLSKIETPVTQETKAVPEKQTASFDYSLPPNSVVTSVTFRIKPQNDGNLGFLETNPNFTIGGQKIAGTGFEDWGMQSWYSQGCSGSGCFYKDNATGEWVAQRFFPSGIVSKDGKVNASLTVPVAGQRLDVKVTVGTVSPSGKTAEELNTVQQILEALRQAAVTVGLISL